MSDELTGRKEIIFDVAVEMFAMKGYENVSMRTIAEKSGIRVSSIYNHFSGKAEILSDIYQYFAEHMFDNSPTVESLRRSNHEPTLSGFMYAANWSFTGLPPKLHRRMILISRLIYGRFLYDAQARDVFQEHFMRRNTLRRQEFFEYARSLGHIAQGTDISDLAELLVFVRVTITIAELSAQSPGDSPFVDNMSYSKEYLGHLLLALMERYFKGGAAGAALSSKPA